MRKFSVSIAADGSALISSSKAILGFGGEHNVAELLFTVDTSEDSVFSKAEYFRLIFDEYISDALYAENGTFSFIVPQEAVTPPAVNCQLVGFLDGDSSSMMIAKSEIFEFDVRYSKKAKNELSTKPDEFQRTLMACETAKKVSQESAEHANLSAQFAASTADDCRVLLSSCQNNAQIAQTAANNATEAYEQTVSIGESLAQAASNYKKFANAIKGKKDGAVVALCDVSPIEHELDIKVKVEALKELSFEATDNIILYAKGVTAINIIMDDGYEATFGRPEWGTFDAELVVSVLNDGILMTSTGTVTICETGEVITDCDTDWSTGDALIVGVRVDSGAISVNQPIGLYTLKKHGKNLFDSERWYSELKAKGGQYGDILKTTVDGVEYIKYAPNGMHDYQFMKGEFAENTAYTLSFLGINISTETIPKGLRIQYTDGTGLMCTFTNTVETAYSFTTDKNKTIDHIWLYYYANEYALIRNIQLEVAESATEYEAYKEPTEYAVNADGTVSGVMSDYPATSLTVNDSEMEVVYNKDTNKVIEQLTNAIISLGGNL